MTTAWTRRPVFWIGYLLLAGLALVTALRLFPQAIPLVNLDIKLARHEALAAARTLAAERDLAPPNARTAVRFAHDDATQNYIELEGGGKRAFAQLIESSVYAPYWWEVRLFAPGEITESVVRFRPDGKPYGFTLKVPEGFAPADPKGLALSVEEARRIAENEASAHWGIDLSRYSPLEDTQQRRPNGRLDHAFVYERIDTRVGEARFRVRLGVAGNRLNELSHFAFVPQAFERRYQELRSANNTIASVATLSAGVLYGLGGCILAVLWLLRERWLLWRPALRAGLVVGGLMGAAALANTPVAWFGYDTAEPLASFWLKQIGGAFFVLIGGGFAYALVFMAAESLSRRAFPHHPQLWKLWTREAAASPAVLGRTVGGYLFVALELAFIAIFYYATNRWLGWWQPSEALTDPNILGSAVPALAPIGISLQAGFMEESLFRAVPLSLAALIGARYGRRGLFIGIAAIVQALIFGGAHANYPGFPAYSRLVELFIPSLLWAMLFLRFGLLVTILMHASFDLCLFAIPLFLVDAPGSTLQRGLVIAAGLVPLAVVLVQRYRSGAWHELAHELRNGGWKVGAAVEDTPSPTPLPAKPLTRWMARLHAALPALGLAGLVLWGISTPFRADVPTLPIGKSQAISVAERALAARGVTLDEQWRRFARVRLAPNESPQSDWHEFVWREGGRELYTKLMGGTLAPPLWEVRFARFTGDVVERAEEWRITVAGSGKVRQVRHVLPEGKPGPNLDRDAALALAERAVRTELEADPGKLRLVGAEQMQQPARRDWSFEFADPAVKIGEGGEARLQVVIAGDQVANAGRYVFIPESWMRTQRERQSQFTFIKLALAALAGVFLVAGLVFAATQWMRRRFDRRALFAVAAISFTLAALA
ncbi:MAG: CPBP family intramembrane metalloprotease, partial [Pseudomonadota bacterium]|nr:CPBP family intramembrane metalloprotease [Pseudomonadota bacterium]